MRALTSWTGVAIRLAWAIPSLPAALSSHADVAKLGWFAIGFAAGPAVVIALDLVIDALDRRRAS